LENTQKGASAPFCVYLKILTIKKSIIRYMLKKQLGFTLIELLVVIAIIGILAAVVLASLNDARKGGSDAAVEQALDGLKAQAGIIYNANGVYSYAGVCDDSKVQDLVNSAAKNGMDADKVGTFESSPATAAAWDTAVCHSQASGWVAAAPLSDSTNATTSLWCVDSTGFSGRDTTPFGATDLTCN
jgi:prepilin-type N-terminal cleavage/methylation domain-containing protein